MIRSLTDLNKEANDIQLQIRKLLLNDYSYDDAITDKLTVISTVTDLRNKLAVIQKEIRERTPGR